MKRTREDAEETRKNLIKVGVHVFRKKSYAATRLSDIAEAAGVTRGAIYHHFGSKSELLKAVGLEYQDYFKKLFDDYLDTSSTENPFEALKSILLTIFNKLQNDTFFRHFMEILIKTDMNKELPEIAELFMLNKLNSVIRIQDILAIAQKQGFVKEGLDIQKYSFFILSATFGTITFILENFDKINISEYDEVLSDYILAAAKL